MVDKARFGERHVCFACGCKFYDLHRSPPVCPRCATDVSAPPKQVEEDRFAMDFEEDEEIDEEAKAPEVADEEVEIPGEEEEAEDA